jgi:DNA-binding XRE family transcriptional regulator
MTDLTPQACAAGRALLGWSAEELAHAAGVGRAAIVQYESASRAAYISTEQAIIAAFKAHGVEISALGAVRRAHNSSP